MNTQFTKWPNGLGLDFNGGELWLHKDAFRVFTERRVLRVPYTVTDNPATAVSLCQEQGLIRIALDEMEPWEAQALYFASVPTQKELF